VSEFEVVSSFARVRPAVPNRAVLSAAPVQEPSHRSSSSGLQSRLDALESELAALKARLE
jgi:uncharacterized protein YceH (UPF0502 family)